MPVDPTATLVEDLVALAAIPAPTFAEEARIGWIERRLAGLPGRRFRDAAGNLIWSWGDGHPRLLVTAHVDTVFPAGTPLEVRRDRGRLRGPGVGDNAAAIAAVIGAAAGLLADGGLGDGAVAFTVGEEGLGDLRGARAACAALRPQAVLAVEGHGLDRVFVDAVGCVRARLVVTGPGGHSWVDRGRPSAVHALVETASQLLGHGTADAPVNIGSVEGGTSVNTIADSAELVVERRALDETPLDAFVGVLAALAAPPPLRLEIEHVGRRPSGRLDRDAPLLNAVRDVRAELDLPDVLEPASTDANAALALGIPALAVGVARGDGMHTVVETIEVASLAVGRRQVELLLRRLLGPA